MGRRKERRLAAKTGAGRRVKLDIFAEPSGDSGGLSGQDEFCKDMDPKHRAGLPNSPSSSGKEPENPLSLLGQYSDDELCEESSKVHDDATEKYTVDNDEQVKEPNKAETDPSKDLDAEKDKPLDSEIASVSLDAPQNLENLASKEINSAVVTASCKEVIPVEETSVPEASDIQLTGDLISSWKLVLHEESGQYYYWNTVTGETSWVVPDALAQETEMISNQKTASNIEGLELDGSITIGLADSVNHDTQEIYETGFRMEERNSENKVKGLEEKVHGLDANQSEAKIMWESGDALLSNGGGTCGGSEMYPNNSMFEGEYHLENDLGSSVLKESESLLDRLKSLKGTHLQGHDWISHYILEVEIRLSDIKSLLPFGSSLLPFWVHCERQLKELEGAIDNQVSQIFNYGQTGEAESQPKSREIEGNEIADGNKKEACSAFENYHASADVTSSSVQRNSKHEAFNGNSFHADAICCSSSHSDSGTEGNNRVREAAQLSELAPQNVVHVAEDVDMDVDMEVEDEIPASASVARDSLAAECCAHVERPIQESFVPQEYFSILPPPDDDWIPPPPPDNELVPSPPPDDPSEPSYPPPPRPTYFETIPHSYAEQYKFSYPGSNFEYHGQVNAQFSALDVAVPHPPLYFEAMPSTYGVTASALAVANPVEPVVYHDLQDGTVLPAPVVSSAQSSVWYSESGYDTLGSDQIGPVNSHAEARCTLLSNTEVGVCAVNGGTEEVLVEVPFTTATIQDPVTVSVVETAHGSSTVHVAPVSVATKSTATNGKSKVLRNKKRTVSAVSTLKSNKKVSSLLDKWKAAKEELQEDVPENTCEMLEKKRHREIEEWRAQQIASGDAKINANFQPLGGDWRERVKHKRAQLNRESTRNSSASPTDLKEVSGDLPSEWKAYWDESSKQFYYGNTITSETTWTRPTKFQ